MYPQAPHYSSCSPSHRIPQSLAVPEVSGPVQLHTGEVNHDQKVFVASSSATTALPTQEASPVVRKRKFQEDIATPALSWDEDEDEEYDACSRSDDEAAGVLYIGNFSQVKEFFYRRFDELTTKPLRTVVTAWVKILEPRRQSNYGPYHKKLSSERPPEHTPPRWPSNVPYNEPSHLSKHGKASVFLNHHRIVTYSDQILMHWLWTSFFSIEQWTRANAVGRGSLNSKELQSMLWKLRPWSPSPRPKVWISTK